MAIPKRPVGRLKKALRSAALAALAAAAVTAAANAASPPVTAVNGVKDAAQTDAPAAEAPAQVTGGLKLRWGLEAKASYRDSDDLRLVNPHPFPPEQLPVGQTKAFLQTVDPGRHFELSNLALTFDAVWSATVVAHAKVDFIQLYDRNPTSSDSNVDVDELWLRLGRDPARPAPGFAGYAKLGKLAHFERQNDRHLESYGLVATAFNRFEDQGLELGLDFGKYFYLRWSATQGNPVFIRDPNALAGDNGTPERSPQVRNPDPPLHSGFPIFYDAEVEDVDLSGKLEYGGGLGFRLGDPTARRGADVLVWGYQRKLAKSTPIHGSFYGGDLDLLDGPGDNGTFSLPITDDEKREVGGNIWLYRSGLSLFAQYVDQDLAGMQRVGLEAELAWQLELPLVWAAGERQLFPSIAPAVRYSHLDPRFIRCRRRAGTG